MEESEVLIQVKEESGKTNYIVHTLFSLAHCEAVRKAVVPFAVCKYKLYRFTL